MNDYELTKLRDDILDNNEEGLKEKKKLRIIEYKITDIEEYDEKELEEKKLAIKGAKLYIRLKYKNDYTDEIVEIDDEYTYITQKQFDYYKNKCFVLEKYYIGEIKEDIICNKLILDKVKFFKTKLNETKLETIKENINKGIIIVKSIFSENILFNNLDECFLKLENNKFEGDVILEDNNLYSIDFESNQLDRRFTFNRNVIKKRSIFKNNKFEEYAKFHSNNFSFVSIKYNKFNKRFELLGNKFNKELQIGNCEFLNIYTKANIYIKDTYFYSCLFLSEIRISEEEFKQKLSFYMSEMNKNFYMEDSNITGYFLLTKTICKNSVNISKSQFNNHVIFDNTTIKKNLHIKKVKIKDEMHLELTTINILLTISLGQLDSVLYIDEEKINKIILFKLINNGRIEVINLKDNGKILLRKCMNLPLNKLNKKSNILIENNENVNIKETLLVFRDNFRKISREDIEDNFYYEYKKYSIRPNYHSIYRKKESVGIIENIKLFIKNLVSNTKRYSQNKNKENKGDLRKFLSQYVFEISSGFGTKPKRIFITMTVIIFLFAIIYYVLGIDQFIGQQEYNILADINNGETIVVKVYGDELSSLIKLPIIGAIYFSTITFLTIGYGDISAWSDVVALLVAFEGMLGVGLMSYLSFAIIRKMIR